MISLQPQEQFAIVRQLADHTDSTTYYVRAVIRNSITNAIIDIVNLDDKSVGRFLKIWEVPADVSGLGFYIDITTSVYTDSDYSTKAPTYGDELEDYLVFDRHVSGGGGGMDVDYKKIDKLVIAAIKTIPEVKLESLEPIKKALEAIKMEISGIEMPEMEKMDHTPVLLAIGRVEKNIIKSISEKEITPETNLEDVINKIKEVLDKEPNLDGVYSKIQEVKKTFDEFVNEYRTEQSAEGKLGEITQSLSNILGGNITSPKNIKKNLETRVKNLM